MFGFGGLGDAYGASAAAPPPPAPAEPPPPVSELDEIMDDKVLRWRFEKLIHWGLEFAHATTLAKRQDVDLYYVLGLIDRGCPPELAYEIAR